MTNSAGPTPPLRFEHDTDGAMHYLHAYTSGEPNQVGVISWRSDNGLFLGAWVDERYRRRGIATELWQEAVRRSFRPPIRMTGNRTDEGHVWASTLSTGVERIGDSFVLEAARNGDY